jgi:uncharacterized protein YceH (UPF0502 family)
VLGCLVEKQLTTPQQYPLTLNALTMATNQTTNRDPVVTLDDDAVLAALDELRSHHLIRVVLPSHGRSVNRYRHVLDEVYGLDAPRYALVATLLLRGPQTLGELRARSERMAEFPSVGDVQDELAALAEHSEGLARLLPRRPGQKEDRWQQIVAEPWGGAGGSAEEDGVIEDGSEGAQTGEAGVGSTADTAPPLDSDLRLELETLRSELASLRSEMADIRKDLDTLQQELGG